MKRCLIIAALMMFSGVLFPFCASADAGAFLVMNAHTGSVLEQQNMDVRLPMASTTKIMTALVVLENVSLEETVVISKESVGIEGSSLYLREGEHYTVEELLYGLLLRSANDCADALARYVKNTKKTEFVSLMNLRAREMGAKNTCFKNPSGLPEEGHYTTARELAAILSEAMKNEEFCKITATKSKEIKGEIIVNHNKLLQTVEGCIGGKTGYTKQAGRCLASVAERDGGRLVCVTLGRGNDWEVHAEAYERWFEKSRTVRLVSAKDYFVEIPSAGFGTVRGRVLQDFAAVLFGEEKVPRLSVQIPSILYGNKEKGTVIGCIQFESEGRYFGECAVVLCEDLEIKPKQPRRILRIFRFFRRLFLKKS